MYEQIAANKRRSIMLLFGFLALYGLLGWLASLYLGTAALVIGGTVAVVMLVINLFMGDDLAVLVAGGKRISKKEDAPELWRLVENLSITAGLPMPRVYISADQAPNAFAAGRTPDQAIVCVTSALLHTLDEAELEGVLAHELSHIRNYDVRLMTYAAVLAGSIAMLSEAVLRILFWGGGDEENANPIALIGLIAGAILAPIAAILIQMAISRRREYVADAAAVELTRYPQGLASALMKISTNMKPSNETGSRSIAHLMIAPPLSPLGRASKLFATHPPTEDRIARLTEMAGGQTHNPHHQSYAKAPDSMGPPV